MGKFRFTFEQSRCTGCMACRMACKEAHDLGIGEGFRTVTLRDGFRSDSCRHCAHPACVEVCPAGAIHIMTDGTVVLREGLCAGCGACVAACPYGHPFLSKTSGLARKCTGCIQRREAGLAPVCVAACPTRALGFVCDDGRGGDSNET